RAFATSVSFRRARSTPPYWPERPMASGGTGLHSRPALSAVPDAFTTVTCWEVAYPESAKISTVLSEGCSVMKGGPTPERSEFGSGYAGASGMFVIAPWLLNVFEYWMLPPPTRG